MVLSALVHILPIIGIRFVMPTPKRIPAAESLEIVLVNKKTKSAPNKPDVFAQANLDGGGNTDANQRAKSPLPSNSDEIQLEQKVELQRQLEEQQERWITQLKADTALKSLDQKRNPADSRGLDMEKLRQQAREEAAIAAQISRDYNAYQEKPRKAYVGARAKQSSVAMWTDAWMQKIERTGTHAYPVDARGNKLRGQLRVTVEINKDGSLLNAQVDRSSGNPDLDQAALRIVRLASPFARLPVDLQDESGKPATVLVFTRTWFFGRDDSLGLD